jgi:hypothetical protein
MVGESTLNEYKSFKALVKHQKRVNRVFSEFGAETTLRSCPPSVDKKVPAVAIASCLAVHPRLQEEKRRRKEQEKVKLVTSLLPPFVLRRLNP